MRFAGTSLNHRISELSSPFGSNVARLMLWHDHAYQALGIEIPTINSIDRWGAPGIPRFASGGLWARMGKNGLRVSKGVRRLQGTFLESWRGRGVAADGCPPSFTSAGLGVSGMPPPGCTLTNA